MVIKTILDTDLYKFTTSYAYIKLFPYALGTFSFKDRDETRYTAGFLEALKNELQSLSLVSLTEAELEYMYGHCRFLTKVYLVLLSSFSFYTKKLEVFVFYVKHNNILV